LIRSIIQTGNYGDKLSSNQLKLAADMTARKLPLMVLKGVHPVDHGLDPAIEFVYLAVDFHIRSGDSSNGGVDCAIMGWTK